MSESRMQVSSGSSYTSGGGSNGGNGGGCGAIITLLVITVIGYGLWKLVSWLFGW